jgi:DNA-binding transcriptional LysR family regulator
MIDKIDGIASPRISLDQWRALVAVVDAGSYAAAAGRLHKSQSTVTYAIKKLEHALGVSAFELQGRRAVLTPTGQLLWRRARVLLEEADRLEQAARSVSAGWEPRLTVSADVVFPVWLLLECFGRFGRDSPHTHIEFVESVMGGSSEDLLTGRADLVITHAVPQGFLGEALTTLRFVPVAHPGHPLHALGRALTLHDLRRHRHLTVRESGSRRDAATAVETEQRWTMSNMPTSIGAACRGFGFAWYPEHKIRDELASGTLKVLPLTQGRERFVTMYMALARPEASGPAVERLAQIIREGARRLAPPPPPGAAGADAGPAPA